MYLSLILLNSESITEKSPIFIGTLLPRSIPYYYFDFFITLKQFNLTSIAHIMIYSILILFRKNKVAGSYLKFQVNSFYGDQGGLQYIGLTGASRPVTPFYRKYDSLNYIFHLLTFARKWVQWFSWERALSKVFLCGWRAVYFLSVYRKLCLL